MNIYQFEKHINHEVFDLIFNGLDLNENAGHPLFNDKSLDASLEFINKIKNIINLINDKLSITKNDGNDYITTLNGKKLESKCYKFDVLLDKFEFKDIIYSPGAKLKLTVYNILNSEKLSNDEYDMLYQSSSGGLIWYSTDKVNKRKFKTNPNKMHIVCFAINGKILIHSFLPIFLHEYLHFYENYNRTKKNNTENFIDNLNTHKKIYNNKELQKYLNDKEIKALYRILYVLFYGEDNARIGTLFGHLVSYNITSLKDFYDNKKYIFYFTEYEKLKEYLDIIRSIDDDIIYYIFYNTNFFRGKDKLKKDISLMTSYKVKKWFVNIIELRLKKYYKRGMKFIGRYIQMLNEYKNDNFISTFTSDEDYNNKFIKQITFKI